MTKGITSTLIDLISKFFITCCVVLIDEKIPQRFSSVVTLKVT